MAKTTLMTALLAGAALAAPLSHALAQTQSQPSDENSATPTATPTAPPTSSRTTVAEVVVHAVSKASTGGGLIKPETAVQEVSTVSSAYIQTQPSILNAYQYVQLTPGALVSTSDPYGLAEQYAINIHGLGQDELGYVLEGMPLNDIGYYSAYPQQFIDSENIDEIALAQGTAELDSPVISAAGGLMRLTMLDPSLRPGGLVDVGYGSYDTDRMFMRLDSGLIGNTGVRGFLSYSYTGSDQWRGPGRGTRQHVDFKLVREWGENRITLSGEWHDGVTPFYTQPTLADFQQDGTKYNYDSTYYPGDYNYYKLYIGTFRIFYTSAPSHFKLADNLTLDVAPYWQYGYGAGGYGDFLTETGEYQGVDGPYTVNIPNYVANDGLVEGFFTDLQYRIGINSKLNYTLGPNKFIAGVWVDGSSETDGGGYYGLSLTGIPTDIWGDSTSGLILLPNGQRLLGAGDVVHTHTVEPYVADILSLLDNKLTIELGFKYAIVSRNGINLLPGPQYSSIIDDAEPLPRAAIKYQIDSHDQVFATISTNFRTPSEATMFNTYYYQDGQLTGAANTNLAPEYATSLDLGYRYSGPSVTASATLFGYYFTNRQESTIVGSAMLPESINAGNETSYGLDLEAGTKPWNHISPYVSAEYLHAQEDSDFPIDGVYLPTAGKTSIRSPELEAALGLSYDDGTFFGNFNVKYVASQYSTFMDDEQIPGYTTANLSAGVRLPPDGLKARPELKLNVLNMTGANYLASVQSPTPNARTYVINGVTVGGSSPTYYLSGGLAVMLTATQAF